MAYSVNPASIRSLTDLPFRALGGQPAFDPADLAAFVAQPRIAVLSYIRADGRPNQAPIWYSIDQQSIVMSIATGSAKHRALQRDNRVCLAIQDERPPYRAVIVDGTVAIEEAPADDPVGYQMAVRYFGKAAANEYWKMSAEDREANGRTLLTLVPSEVKGFDNTKAISKVLLAGVRLRDRLPIPRSWV